MELWGKPADGLMLLCSSVSDSADLIFRFHQLNNKPVGKNALRAIGATAFPHTCCHPNSARSCFTLAFKLSSTFISSSTFRQV
jgi:hypothetical protein